MREEDRVYRVAQRHGFDFYGAGLSVNRLVRLDEQGLHETCERTFGAGDLRGIAGIHHMHSVGVFTVFDYRARLGCRVFPHEPRRETK